MSKGNDPVIGHGMKDGGMSDQSQSRNNLRDKERLCQEIALLFSFKTSGYCLSIKTCEPFLNGYDV